MANKKENNKNCVFCKIASKKIPTEFVYENDNFFAIHDLQPRVAGHTLIIPKKHYVNTLDMPSSLGMELIDAIKNVAEKKLKEDLVEGFNILQNNFPVAGQVVMHAHFHLLPRRKDDGYDIEIK